MYQRRSNSIIKVGKNYPTEANPTGIQNIKLNFYIIENYMKIYYFTTSKMYFSILLKL